MAGLLWRGSLQMKSFHLFRCLQSARTQTSRITRLVQSPDLGITCVQCSQSRGLSSLTQTGVPLLSPSRHDVPQQGYHAKALSKKDVFSRMIAKLGFKGKLRYKRRVLQRSGIRAFLCAVELVDSAEFFEELPLPDTFNSWFRITELHVWMCFVRLASEGREGVFLRNNMLKNMWEDVNNRSKRMGEEASATGRREGIQQLSEEFRANLYSYDEGILSDDKVLAGTVWRNFFEMKCDDAESLEKMVHYIRKQMRYIDSQDSEMILATGVITFLPFNGDKLNMERTKPILKEILNRT